MILFSPLQSPLQPVLRGPVGSRPVASGHVLNFAALTPIELASRFGWSLTGAATMIDSGGDVVYGANALNPYTNDISNWDDNGCSVSGAVGDQLVTTTGGGQSRYLVVNPVAGLTSYQMLIGVSAGNTDAVEFGYLDGTAGLFVDITSITIVSGPGTVSEPSAGIGRVEGLQTGAMTLVRATLAAPANSSTHILYFYPKPAVVGNSVRFHGFQLSLGEQEFIPTTSAARYLPRYTYHPTTHAALGLLIEPQVTNLVPYSNMLSSWTNYGATVAQNATGIDGSTTAWTVTDAVTGGSALRYIETPSALTAGANTLSFYVGKTSGAQSSYPYVGIDDNSNLSAITIDTSNGIATLWTGYSGYAIHAGQSVTCFSHSATLWKVTLTFTATASVYTVYLAPAATANSTKSSGALTDEFSVTGSAVFAAFQLEAGSVATSYIPNATSGSLVRAADGNWDIGASNGFPELWGAGSERTIVCEWYDTGTALEHALVMGHVAGSIANEAIGIYVNASNELIYYAKAGGVMQVTLTGGTIVAGTLTAPARNKAAFRFGAGAFGVSLNGAAEVTGAGTVPTVTDLRVAGAALVAANPHHDILKSLSSSPTAITGAALQALSAL